MNQTQRNYAIARLEEIASATIKKMVEQQLPGKLLDLRNSIGISKAEEIREIILQEFDGAGNFNVSFGGWEFATKLLNEICDLDVIVKKRIKIKKNLEKQIRAEVEEKLKAAKDGIMLGNAEEVKKAIANFENDLILNWKYS